MLGNNIDRDVIYTRYYVRCVIFIIFFLSWNARSIEIWMILSSWHKAFLKLQDRHCGKINHFILEFAASLLAQRQERTCLWYRRSRFGPWIGKILWTREWQPTAVFLPGESHGQRRLAGNRPWSCKYMTEWLKLPLCCLPMLVPLKVLQKYFPLRSKIKNIQTTKPIILSRVVTCTSIL